MNKPRGKYWNDSANVQFRDLVLQSGWSQADVARNLGVSPGVVSQYMSGTTRPSGTTLGYFKLQVGDQLTHQKQNPQQGKTGPPPSENLINVDLVRKSLARLKAKSDALSLEIERCQQVLLGGGSSEEPDPYLSSIALEIVKREARRILERDAPKKDPTHQPQQEGDQPTQSTGQQTSSRSTRKAPGHH